jgi:hypothetical protein
VHGLLLILSSGQASGTRTSLPDFRRTTWFALGGLTLLAIALRIPGLNSCMWLDEVLTMVRFARPPVSQILTSFPDQNQHMLYSLLAHASLRTFGEQVWALRLPSVLFGVGSMWALFLVGRRLIGETQALLACALMTVSYHHIWFSQNARGYMGLLFFTNLSTWLWLEAMDRDRWTDWLGYALAISLGMWIHMTMLFVVGVHFLISAIAWYRLGHEFRRVRLPLLAFLLCGTLTLQLYALVLPEFFRTAVSEASTPSEWTNPLWVLQESLRSLQAGFAALTVVLAGGFFLAAGWMDLLRKDWRAAWAIVLPGITGASAMLLLGHNLWPRFFFFCMGFALLIAVHGAMEVPRLLAGVSGARPPCDAPLHMGSIALPAGYVLAGMMIAASALTLPKGYRLPKQDFLGARDYVEQEKQANDSIAVVGLAQHAYQPYYAPRWAVVSTIDQLTALQARSDHTFVVYTLPIELRAVHPKLWKAIQTNYEVRRVFWGTLGGGEVYVCRDRSPRTKLQAKR